MTEENFKELKDAYINHLKEMMIEEGQLYPVITIFADHIDNSDTKGAIVHLPIPGEYMKNDEKKDEFIDVMLPQIAEQVKERFIPYALAWSAEAWMTTADKKDDGTYEMSKEKDEVIIITIETDYSNETFIYKIIRNMKVDKEEGLKETIELEKKMDDSPLEGTEGRFTGLLKKFKDV